MLMSSHGHPIVPGPRTNSKHTITSTYCSSCWRFKMNGAVRRAWPRRLASRRARLTWLGARSEDRGQQNLQVLFEF